MTHDLLKCAHILGAILMGAGLVSVWMADLRSRQLRELAARRRIDRRAGRGVRAEPVDSRLYPWGNERQTPSEQPV